MIIAHSNFLCTSGCGYQRLQSEQVKSEQLDEDEGRYKYRAGASSLGCVYSDMCADGRKSPVESWYPPFGFGAQCTPTGQPVWWWWSFKSRWGILSDESPIPRYLCNSSNDLLVIYGDSPQSAPAKKCESSGIGRCLATAVASAEVFFIEAICLSNPTSKSGMSWSLQMLSDLTILTRWGEIPTKLVETSLGDARFALSSDCDEPLALVPSCDTGIAGIGLNCFPPLEWASRRRFLNVSVVL